MLSLLTPHPFDDLLHDAIMADARRSMLHHRGWAGLARLDRELPTLKDDGAAYVLTLAAPGISPPDLSIEATDGRMHIKGATDKSMQLIAGKQEIDLTVALPEDADADAASASAADGLLTVKLPKKAQQEPKSITVKTIAPSAEAEAEIDEATRPYKLTLVTAGLAPADLSVTAEAPNVLTAKGKTKRTGAELDRVFKLPRNANAFEASASCVDGILELAVPKMPKAAPKALVVNAPVEVEATMAEAAAAKDEEKMDEGPLAAEAPADGEEDAVMV